jgi:hypothetical protein
VVFDVWTKFFIKASWQSNLNFKNCSGDDETYKKTKFFGFSTMVQIPLKIQKKNSKLGFLINLSRYLKIPFLRPKKCSIIFWLQLVPGTIVQKKILKT